MNYKYNKMDESHKHNVEWKKPKEKNTGSIIHLHKFQKQA